jgi:hypothetical protein
MRTLVSASLLIAISTARAATQELSVTSGGAVQRGLCYLTAAPECPWTLLTEASVGALLVAPGRAADVPDVRGGLLVGMLRAVGPRDALGGGVEVGFWGFNGSWFLAAQPRYRHWLSARAFMDGSIALRTTFAEGLFRGQSVAARVDVTHAWIGVWTEAAYWLADDVGGTSGAEFVAGARAAGLAGVVLASVGGIVALIAAAATLGGS